MRGDHPDHLANLGARALLAAQHDKPYRDLAQGGAVDAHTAEHALKVRKHSLTTAGEKASWGTTWLPS
jgi:hypothetical protein